MRNIRILTPWLIAILITCISGCSGSPDQPGKKLAGKEDPSATSLSHADTGPAAKELLRQSAYDGKLEKVRELLDAGVDVNAQDGDGHTALMFAAFNGHSEIVLLLLDHEAVIERRDLMGRTALLYAATGPFPETVKILLDKGAEPNIVDSNEHFSPLMHAAAEGNLDVVKILLEYNADRSFKDVDGDDAESFARQAGHTEIADLLRSHR